jgi:PAS domain S-box-containing protein
MLSAPVELSAAFFRGVADASPDCLRLLTLDGRVQYMNRRGQALFGIDDFENYRDRPWAELWPAEYRDQIKACVAEAAAGRISGFRGCYPGCKGSKWWQSELSPIRGDDGRPVAILALSRDVSAEVESAAFLREVLERLPAPVVVKRAADGQFVLINRAAEDVLGVAAADLLGKTVFDLVTEEQAIRFTEEDAEVIRSRAVKIEEEEQMTTASQGVRYFITKKMATFDEHGPSHIFTIFEDVSERRQATIALGQALTEAEQANRAKSAFLANMSHEIRTPLNGVIAVADLLARSELNPRQHELVEIIRASGATLQTLLSDILDLAKIESGQIVIEQTPFDLCDLLQSTAALFRMRADEKGLTLTCTLDAEVGWVAGDPLRVRQILSNLLSNAIKFTERGGVNLHAQRSGGGVLFTVSDTGIGFDADFKARMFGRFQQADASITRKFGGSGLGLSICRELAELMGGALGCDAEPGVGARFWFDLPLPPAERAVQAVAYPTEVAAVEKALRILVADDHPTNRRVVSLVLAGMAEVVCVENGAEAVEMVAREPFDLVLMDMQMPVMDGLTAVRAIRRASSPAARLPIIVLSANALSEHVQASLEAGADAHVSKPITADSLILAITRLVGGGREAA